MDNNELKKRVMAGRTDGDELVAVEMTINEWSKIISVLGTEIANRLRRANLTVDSPEVANVLRKCRQKNAYALLALCDKIADAIPTWSPRD